VLTDIRGAVHRFNGAQGFLLGAALSFAFLLCLAPLALLFFSGTGYLLASDQAAGSVITIATSLLPGHSSEIRATLDLLNRERRVTGVLGVIGLAIFATPLFALMRTALNAAFRVQKARGLVHGFAFDLFALAVIGFLAIALAAALLMLATLANITAGAGTPAPFLTGVWVRAVAPALLYVTLLGLLLFVYRTFPNTGVSTRAAVTSTLIVAALWEIARRAFAVYLTSFGTYGKLYGSFGVAAATLAWIYYSATIFVFGAGLTAVLTERYRGAAPEVELVAFDAESVRGPRSRLAWTRSCCSSRRSRRIPVRARTREDRRAAAAIGDSRCRGPARAAPPRFATAIASGGPATRRTNLWRRHAATPYTSYTVDGPRRQGAAVPRTSACEKPAGRR
jgi:membrane protein